MLERIQCGDWAATPKTTGTKHELHIEFNSEHVLDHLLDAPVPMVLEYRHTVPLLVFITSTCHSIDGTHSYSAVSSGRFDWPDGRKSGGRTGKSCYLFAEPAPAIVANVWEAALKAHKEGRPDSFDVSNDGWEYVEHIELLAGIYAGGHNRPETYLNERELKHSLGRLIVDYGSEAVLKALAEIFQSTESAGNGYHVGQVLEALANWEW